MTVSDFSTFLFIVIIIFAAVLLTVGLILIVKARRRSLGSGLIFIGIVAVVLSLSGLMFTATATYFSRPYSCVLCHEMKPEFNTWKQSAHNRISCLACHMPVGGVGTFVLEEWTALGEVVDHFTGKYPLVINSDSHVSKEMKSGVCERCHDMETARQIRVTTDLKMNHKKHLKTGITCPYCHNRVTHRGARGYPYFNGMTMMQGCYRCHQPGRAKKIGGQTAPTACGVCHRQSDWTRTVFGKDHVDSADFDRCRDCHRLRNPKLVATYDTGKMAEKEVDCSDCHGSHDKDFTLDPPTATCTDCHEKAADDVISGKMGFKGYKQPFKKADAVRCGLCHPPHGFKAVRPGKQ